MKTSLVALLLVLANLASGQTAASPQPQASQPQASPAQPQTQKKEIKDPAEYNAYVGAVQQTDPAAKISGLEAFLTQYPNSVMKEDALELLMGTYQQANNQAKVIDAANRLLAANPEQRSQPWCCWRTTSAPPRSGRMPNNMPNADCRPWTRCPRRTTFRMRISPSRRPSSAGLLNSVAGFSALQLKDYAAAQKYLRPAVEADPNNVENVYPLALSYLTATPSDDVNGLFFIARAANLVSDPEREGLDRQIRSQPLREVSRLRPGLGRPAGPDQDHAAAAGRIHHHAICSSNSAAASR